MINYNYTILKLSIQNYYIYYYLIMHLRDNQVCLHLLSPKKGIHKSLLTLLCSHQQEQQRRQHQKQQEGSSCMFILLLWLPSAALLRHFSLSVCARRHSCPLSLSLFLSLSLSPSLAALSSGSVWASHLPCGQFAERTQCRPTAK